MKQARRWLLTVALALLPAAAYAAKPGKTPATAPAAASAPAADPSAPAPAPSDSAATTDTGPATGDATGGGDQTDVCAITPDAPECKGGPVNIDLKKAATKTAYAEIFAVEQIYFLRKHRFEINPYYSVSLNDQFVGHPAPGISLNYYVSNVLAVGVGGNLYAGQNVDSDFNFENRRATRVAVPLTEYSWGGNVNLTYVPMYGKFAAGFGDFIFHYDAYIVGGLGVIDTRPIAVIDPDNRTFPFKLKADVDLGIGLRIALNRWLAVTLEVRDYIYDEQLESLTIAQGPVSKPSDPTSPLNSQTWYDKDSHLTNNVQAQIGLSMFLPFSWEYRLPK